MAQFSYNIAGTPDRLITPCVIDITDYQSSREEKTDREEVHALWDTGATVTVVSSQLVDKLGLIPNDITNIRGVNGQSITTNVYNIDIRLGDIYIEFVNAVEVPLATTDMIIGMDIINYGNLHIDHQGNSTNLFFIQL